jgi:hypothetical protein
MFGAFMLGPSVGGFRAGAYVLRYDDCGLRADVSRIGAYGLIAVFCGVIPHVLVPHEAHFVSNDKPNYFQNSYEALFIHRFRPAFQWHRQSLCFQHMK